MGSWAATPAKCQERCANTPGCAYFSVWGNGGCHLSVAGATQIPAIGVTSGPGKCPESGSGGSGEEVCIPKDLMIDVVEKLMMAAEDLQDEYMQELSMKLYEEYGVAP